MILKIKKLSEDAVIPEKAHKTDAGFDLTAISKKVEASYIEYDTGISIEIPEGYVGKVYCRSSISKKDLVLCNGVGIIDSGYTGSIKFRFKIINPENKQRWALETYEVGDKIGQIIIEKLLDVEFTVVEELGQSDRGSNGFGSSGV